MTPWHAKEHIKKICPECGSSFEIHPCEDWIVCCSGSCAQKRRFRTQSHPLKGFKFNAESKAKLRASHLGKGGPTHPNWKHGKRRDRSSPWWRIAVFERDNYECQICHDRGRKNHAVILNAHHVYAFAKYPELRHDITNGLTLCVSCHKMVHSKKLVMV
jgi:5-methylcytosine-specific restriction endonuclease McrA